MAKFSPLFSCIPLTYHVPHLGLLKRILDSFFKDHAIIYHPYSQTIFEASYEDALILKLYEVGFKVERIAKLLKLDKKSIVSLLRELEEQLRSFQPKEQLHYNHPSTLWLITDLRCNMRCRYCYTSFGSFNLNSAITNVKFKTVKSALDVLLKTFPSIKAVNIFGGGEPLLSFNVIKQLIKYVESQGYELRFGIVTNGTLLNKEIAEFFHTHRVKVTLSIDGPQLVNDINRTLCGGAGSYQLILKSINLLKNLEEDFAIQATYTPDAYELGYELTDVVEHLKEFTPYILIKTADYVSSLRAGYRFFSAEIGEMNMRYISKAFEELEKSKPEFYDINVSYALSYIARKAAKVAPCPFTSFITLFPDGALKLCHMLIDYELGNVKSDPKVLKEKYQKAIEISQKFAVAFSYKDIWMSSIQDICPGELCGGITKFLYSKKKIRLPVYVKDILSTYWDSFLINIYKSLKKNTLEAIYKNVESLFNEKVRLLHA